MATKQDFLKFLRSEDANPESLKAWLEENQFNIDSEIIEGHIHGRTALHWAAYNGDETTVRILLEAGANVEGLTAEGIETSEPSALSGAIIAHHTSIALLLLANGANPNLTNQYGMNALHQAADERESEVVNAIFSARVPIIDINARNSTTEERLGDGRTALDYAEEGGYLEIIDAINNFIGSPMVMGVSGHISGDMDTSI